MTPDILIPTLMLTAFGLGLYAGYIVWGVLK
jgi:hypothetical protein